MLKAVIFDMDGVLIDSEKIHTEAFVAVLRSLGKKPVQYGNGLYHPVALPEREIWKLFKEKYSLHEEIEDLVKKRGVEFLKLIEIEAKPMDGVLNLLGMLKNEGIKLAVASNTELHQIERILEKLAIRTYFQEIVSGQFIKKGKPNPDIFLECARRLDVKPENCCVIEDAERGVEAGHRAGMVVIAVPHEFTAEHDFSKANMIVKSLEEVNIEKIKALFQK